MAGFASLLLLAVCATLTAAQKPSAASLTATDLAKRVDEHYNKLHTLKASFAEQYDGLGMHRSDSGVMLLQKPGKMRWDYQSTPGKLFVLDGKYAWFYSPGDTQVQRIAASKLDDLRSPLRFLLGHTKLENELVDLKVFPAQASKPEEYELTGVPKGQEKRIAKLSLDVTVNGEIHGITIEEIDGARTTFTFTSEEPNAKIAESAFHFIAPAGVPVVDALPPI